MIEILVKTHLDSQLEVPVYMERPEKPSSRFLLVEKTGGDVQHHLKSATIAIQSYAESLYEAAQLNEMVKDAMAHLVDHVGVSGLSLNSDYNFTDTATKAYRYQAVYDINYY